LHNEFNTSRGGDGHRDVDKVTVHHLSACRVDDSVDCRELLQSRGGGAQEEGHEAQLCVVLLLELVLVLVANLNKICTCKIMNESEMTKYQKKKVKKSRCSNIHSHMSKNSIFFRAGKNRAFLSPRRFAARNEVEGGNEVEGVRASLFGPKDKYFFFGRY
jgi:hypothetical protein